MVTLRCRDVRTTVRQRGETRVLRAEEPGGSLAIALFFSVIPYVITQGQCDSPSYKYKVNAENEKVFSYCQIVGMGYCTNIYQPTSTV